MTPDGMPNDGSISFLSVGTKILLKDSMDQLIRTLGDFRTFYASNMASALRVFSENTIHVVLTEVEIGDASAFRFIQALGGSSVDDDLFVIMALEERNEQTMALAEELEVNAVLIKPFSAADVKVQVESYKAWREMPKEPWRLLVHEANLAIREKRFRDAENNFKDAVNCSPGNPKPLYKSALYYLGKPDFYAVAETMLKKAIELKPDYVAAISALGSLYLARHELDKADLCFRKANSICPLNPDRLTEMVRLNLERATETCKVALRLDPGSTQARYQLGKLMAIQKDYVGTIRELEKVMHQLKEDPKKEAQTFVALARKLGGLVK